MNVVVTLDDRFDRTPDGRVWTQTTFPYSFWSRYLQVFDSVRVVAREMYRMCLLTRKRQTGNEFPLRLYPITLVLGNAAIAQKEPNMRLLLVSDGLLCPQIEQKAIEMGLDKYVIFAGLRSDVPRLMLGAMDTFVLPSLYEGLGLVLIEAQAAGLPCVFSDIVPEEADVIKPLVQRISLSKSPFVKK